MSTSLTRHRHHARVQKDLNNYYGSSRLPVKQDPGITQEMVDHWNDLKGLPSARQQRVLAARLARWTRRTGGHE